MTFLLTRVVSHHVQLAKQPHKRWAKDKERESEKSDVCSTAILFVLPNIDSFVEDVFLRPFK